MCGISEYETSLVAQMVRHLSTMQESWVRSLGWEDPLEKEMATHSGILAWRIPRTEKPGRLQSTGRKESDMTEKLHFLNINYSDIHCNPLMRDFRTFLIQMTHL